jgi:subfamily B ATP-binding cassette protein MsbA
MINSRALASVRQFEFARCARLAGVKKMECALCILLACGVAVSDASMLALLVPLGSGGEAAMRFWRWGWLRTLPQPPDPAWAFFWVAGLIFLIGMAKNVFAHANFMMTVRIYTGASRNLANLVFDRYLEFGKAWFDRASPGRIAAIMEFRDDAATIFGSLLVIASNALILAAYLFVMLMISWRLTLLAILLFPLANLGARSILDRTTAAAEKYREATIDVAKRLYGVIASITLFQSSGQERRVSEAFRTTTGRFRDNALRMLQLQGISTRLQDLAALASLLVMLAVTLRTDRARAMQPITMLVFFFIARMSQPLLATFPEEILKITAKLPGCRELLAVFEDRDKFIVRGGAREFQGLREGIQLRGLNFCYPDGPPVLQGVSFELRKERITALVGPSGSGKSTIANLLMRFYDLPADMILIDGIDIREYSIRSLRQAFSIVSQDTVLLNETLRVNLLFGVDREVGARELESVIEEARLQDVVAMLPDGLEGQVGERGAQLSGGQRQRVAIARAMLRRSSLLILDEATSALDSITENLVQEAIGNAMRLCTALVIAHRFSTIKLADHVVVLDGGRVVQQGQFPEMRAADGLFKDMCEKQMLV